jgi:hypothetical protein
MILLILYYANLFYDYYYGLISIRNDVENIYTVNFTYSEHVYSELPVIGNNLFWPEFWPSLFNIKIYGYSEHGYKELIS